MKNSLFILIVPFYFIYTFQAQNISIESDLDSSKQDCKDFIIADETIEGKIQVLKTKSIELISRGNYSYTIELINDQRGIVAKVYSFSGVQFNMGDEIIFMDESNNRIPCPFIEIGENTAEGGKSVNSNILKLDANAIDWFSTNTITTVYVKNNVENEIRKFSIDPIRMAEFKQLASCFKLNLNKN